MSMAHVSVFPPGCLLAWSPLSGALHGGLRESCQFANYVSLIGDTQPDRQPGGWCHHGLGRYLAILPRHYVGQFYPSLLAFPP